MEDARKIEIIFRVGSEEFDDYSEARRAAAVSYLRGVMRKGTTTGNYPYARSAYECRALALIDNIPGLLDLIERNQG